MLINEFELLRNDKCLCGSNKKYKICCKANIDNGITFKDTKLAIKKNEFEEAYVYCNSELTRYLIGMKRHTEPMLSINEKLGTELLEIDLKALQEILDKMQYIIFNGKIQDNFDLKFEQLEKHLNNKMFFQLIRFNRIFTISFIKKNTNMILPLLTELDYKNICNQDLCKIYYLYKNDDIEYSENMELIDRIITNEVDEYEKVKYKTLKATTLFVNNEKQVSISLANKIIKQINSMDNSDLTFPTLIILANSTHFCGLICNDGLMMRKSIEYFNYILKDYTDILDLENIAEAYNLIGDTYLCLGEFDMAITEFSKGLSVNYNIIGKINIARAYLEKNDNEKAFENIRKIAINDIPKNNLLDYLLTMGRILVEKKDTKLANEIYNSLKQYEVSDKLFNQYKHNIIIELLEVYSGFSKGTYNKGLSYIIKKLNEVIDLKPNFMGFGVNINAIIDNLFINKDENNGA